MIEIEHDPATPGNTVLMRAGRRVSAGEIVALGDDGLVY
jgi:hypothetical protein